MLLVAQFLALTAAKSSTLLPGSKTFSGRAFAVHANVSGINTLVASTGVKHSPQKENLRNSSAPDCPGYRKCFEKHLN
ncbi:MAG: hypothetical protein ACXWTP_10430 [Methylosarcina sp.]